MSRCDDHRCNSKQTARQLSSQIWTSLLDWEQEQLVQSRRGDAGRKYQPDSKMHLESLHGSMAAVPLCHVHRLQTMLRRPSSPFTRFGSFRTLQRCLHDAR